MATETQKPTDVKHITHKTGGVNPRDVIKYGAPVFMVRIWGVLQSIKHFEDKNGDPKTVLIGEFAAEGPDEKMYASDKMFCFKALEEKLSGAYTSGGEKPVEFAYDITAVADEKSATGYIYQAKSLIQTAVSDRLSALAKQVGGVAMPKAASQNGKPVSVGDKKAK